MAIGQKRRVLDLAAGYCSVTPELARRSSGRTWALDLDHTSLHEATASSNFLRIVGDAGSLPFQEKSFDLVFCQFGLMWFDSLAKAVNEVWRVLDFGGHLAALEPDFGGMIEYPTELESQDIWVRALSKAGANPYIGRILPDLLEQHGFRVQIYLLDQLLPSSPVRFQFLMELPLREDDLERIMNIERRAAALSGWQQVAHLPIFLIAAEK